MLLFIGIQGALFFFRDYLPDTSDLAFILIAALVGFLQFIICIIMTVVANYRNQWMEVGLGWCISGFMVLALGYYYYHFLLEL